MEMWNPGLRATRERRKQQKNQVLSGRVVDRWVQVNTCPTVCQHVGSHRRTVYPPFSCSFSPHPTPQPPTCSPVTSPEANGDASRAEHSGFSRCCTSILSQCFCRTPTRFSPRNDALLSEPASHASLVAASALQLHPGRRHVLAGWYSALMKSSVLAIHFEVMDVRRSLVAQCVWTCTVFPNSLENRAYLRSSALGVKTWLKFKMNSRNFHDHILESSEATIKPSNKINVH